MDDLAEDARVRLRMCAIALGVVAGAGAGGCLGAPSTSLAASASGSRAHGEAARADAGALAETASANDAGTARVASGKRADAGARGSDADAGAEADEPADVLPPKHYARVLHVGDSTVGGYGGLAKALKKRFTAEETLYSSDTIVSLGIRTFARNKTLKTDIAKVNPDLVLVTLGANDVFLPSPDRLAADVRAIVATVGARDCYWIGPPTWKPDTGIVAVIRENVGHCRFFDSSLLPLARARDGIHPTDRGGEEWAERFWADLRGPR